VTVLYSPRFGASAALALVASALVCYPSWPGYMSYDTLFAYKQSIEGIATAVWPPLHAYLFFVSRKLGAEPGGLFFAQNYLLFFGTFLVFSVLLPGRLTMVFASAAFFAFCIYFPTVVGTLFVSWKDGTTAGFAMAGIAAWLVAVRTMGYPALMCAMFAFGLTMGMRYNAFPLIAPALLLMIYRPFVVRRRPWDIGIAVSGISICLVLAYLSTVIRLPDGIRLASNTGFAAVQIFDLIGVSACAGKNYLPLEVSSRQPLTVKQIRQTYDSRHVHLSLAAKEGVPPLLETDGGGTVDKAWRRILVEEPLCYLIHRLKVFLWLIGAHPDGVFYPTHGGIDTNPYGFELANPLLSHWATMEVVRGANSVWRRPLLIYLSATVAVLYMLVATVFPFGVFLSIYVGAMSYAMALFFVAPAADARYLLPSNVFCLLLIVSAAASFAVNCFDKGSSPRRNAEPRESL
jgi:hypothetical protein